MFTKAENSNFLKGKNDRSWTATFDWLINSTNMAKVLEDNYKNKQPKGGMNDFKDLMEEARQADEQTRDNTSNNTSGW